KLGIISPESTFNAVDLPIPFWPINPFTFPVFIIGKRKRLNPFLPKRCVSSLSSFSGVFIIVKAWNRQIFGQIPHPVQKFS
ncbi:MAG: hypothetical protein ACXADW_19240, partial [Candidatus Hodarchaeales archaeon]